MTKLLTLALAFYLGATAALLIPFASPVYSALALGARLLVGGVTR